MIVLPLGALHFNSFITKKVFYSGQKNISDVSLIFGVVFSPPDFFAKANL